MKSSVVDVAWAPLQHGPVSPPRLGCRALGSRRCSAVAYRSTVVDGARLFRKDRGQISVGDLVVGGCYRSADEEEAVDKVWWVDLGWPPGAHQATLSVLPQLDGMK